eukprot:CAMPEP_0204355496 /NCGR_PEP_ID=MMETSP0469-20131031/34182_1 /ASSEMBLY_ACC=CAM_ASM_000384 /TAXON_ID=2969 /ORGANISM="Oxyrrhis marina" /LENGTH=467 /DNA_ID=CAMNT_0051342753 /DNA_START=926 /DNA_END=2329 /DNA_ORIENTATION=-
MSIRGCCRSGSSLSVFHCLRLGGVASCLGSAALGSSLSVRSCLRLGSGLSLFGALRCGSCQSILDCAALGSTVSVRSGVRLGSSLSVLDFLSLGASLAVRSSIRAGSALATFGVSRLAGALSSLSCVNLGSSLSVRVFTRLGSHIAVHGNVRTQSETYSRRLASGDAEHETLSVTGNANVGEQLAVGGFANLGGGASIIGPSVLGSDVSARGMARLGSGLSVCGPTLLGGTMSIKDAASFGRMDLRSPVAASDVTVSGALSIGDAVLLGDGRKLVVQVDQQRTLTATAYGGTLHGVWTSDIPLTTSDRRLKTEVTPLLKSLGRRMTASGDRPADRGEQDAAAWILRELRPVSFKFKAGPDAKSDRFGFVADEVERVLPSLVRAVPTPDGDQPYKGVLYQDLIAVLTLSAQKQQARVDQLQEVINELLAKIRFQDTINEEQAAEMRQLREDVAELRSTFGKIRDAIAP